MSPAVATPDRCAECGAPATHWSHNGVVTHTWCTLHRQLGAGSPYHGRIRPPKRKPRKR